MRSLPAAPVWRRQQDEPHCNLGGSPGPGGDGESSLAKKAQSRAAAPSAEGSVGHRPPVECPSPGQPRPPPTSCGVCLASWVKAWDLLPLGLGTNPVSSGLATRALTLGSRPRTQPLSLNQAAWGTQRRVGLTPVPVSRNCQGRKGVLKPQPSRTEWKVLEKHFSNCLGL